jgi:hypothetical protein
MIVIGTDTHKQTHTCGAVFAGTGQMAGELTAPARKAGFAELLDGGRRLEEERIWALGDCRHVSGSFERFLVASGERTAGKSDPIDALALARAALREGTETLPAAHLDEAALELKLLLDHREDLLRARSEDSSACAGTCTTSGPTSSCRRDASIGSSGWTGLPASSPAQSRALACAYTEAATASSTAPCTASPSSKAECIHPHGSSWPESELRASQTAKRCAA